VQRTPAVLVALAALVFLPSVATTARPGEAAAASRPHRASDAPCGAAGLRVRVATARRTYRAGEPVPFRVTVRNETGSSCSVPTGTCLPQVVISGKGGLVVWNRAQVQVVCAVGRWRVLLLGKTTARVVSWDGEYCAGRTPASCPGGPAPPGSYTATAGWSSLRHGSMTFRVRG
jgi:hypothetical protein